MIKSKYNWLYEPPTEYINETLIKISINTDYKKLLESKSITDDESIKALLDETIINHDPWLLSDMEKAVTRINEAIDKMSVYWYMVIMMPMVSLLQLY